MSGLLSAPKVVRTQRRQTRAAKGTTVSSELVLRGGKGLYVENLVLAGRSILLVETELRISYFIPRRHIRNFGNGPKR